MRRKPLKMFGNGGGLAVWHPILAQVALSKIRGLDFDDGAVERTSSRRRHAAKALASTTGNITEPCSPADAKLSFRTLSTSRSPNGTFPSGTRIPLPRFLTVRLLRLIEREEPCLSAGVEVQLQGVVVEPGDMQAARLTHDATHTVRFALIAGGIVFRQVPESCHAPPLFVKRNARDVALPGRDHTPTPVFGHHGHPIPSHVDRRQRAGGLWWLRR